MPTCQSCGHKWSWKGTFVRMFTLKNKLRCPSCDSLQYVSKKSRNQISFITFAPFLIWIPLISFGVPQGYILFFELVAYVLVFMGMPFLCELSNKDEPMW